MSGAAAVFAPSKRVVSVTVDFFGLRTCSPMVHSFFVTLFVAQGPMLP